MTDVFRWVKTRKYEWIEDDPKTYPSMAKALDVGPPQGESYNEGIGSWSVERETKDEFNAFIAAMKLENYCQHERKGLPNDKYQIALDNAIDAIRKVKVFF